MPVVPFSTHTNARGYGLPAARMVNLYAEATPDTAGPSARLPRPPLSLSYTIGTGPIRGSFQQTGLFNGDIFAVSGGQVYRGSSIIGAVSDDGLARFAASDNQLVVVIGGFAYCYDGTTFALIADADLPSVSDVAYLVGRFVYSVVDSGQFFWSDVDDATSIDPLAFATAEAAPDAIVALQTLGDELVIFGRSTIEFWQPTGDTSAPFQRVQGRRMERGCAAQGSVVAMDNSIVFIGSDKNAYRISNVPTNIGTPAISREIALSTDLDHATAFAAVFDGHTSWVVNIPDVGSRACDMATGEWHEWASYGLTTFRCRNGVIADGVTYLGDDSNGNVYTLDTSGADWTDNGQPIQRIASVFSPQAQGVQRNYNAVLQCVRGVGNAASTAPVAEMRYSDDGGRTWTDWREATLGAQGRYEDKAVWRNLGAIRAPGRGFEFRVSDPVSVVFQHVILNAPIP